MIDNSKASTKIKKSKNKINPKKLQRKVAKEQKKHPITTQSQQALKKNKSLKRSCLKEKQAPKEADKKESEKLK